MDWARFNLRCMRNGYGLGLTYTEIDEMEWHDVQRQLTMLDEFLKQSETHDSEKEPEPTL